MNKSVYPILVSLLAFILVSPTIGLSHSVIESDSGLLPGNEVDQSRSSYDVLIEYDPNESTPGEDTLTRNEQITINFVVSNMGDEDDTYDLDVSWTDAENDGWYAEQEIDVISIDSGDQEQIAVLFKAPIQGVHCQDNGDGSETCDDMDFNVKATSQNSSSVDSSVNQNLEIDVVYAIDIFLRESSSKSGARSTTIEYSAQVENVGKNTDEFSLYIGDTPKDWGGYTSLSSVTLNPGDSEMLVLYVNIPNTAAVDESASISFIARVQNENYGYIHGFCLTDTSVTDGRTYGVELTTPDSSKQAIPNGSIDYTISIENTGDETDSFKLEIEDSMEEGWNSSLSQDQVNNLGSGEIFTVELTVTSPEGSVEDDWSLCNVSIHSTTREQFTDSIEVNTSVRIPVRNLDLTISDTTKAGNPDAVVVYLVTLTNTGTDPDDFALSTTICEGCNAWTVELNTYLVEDLGKDNSFDIQMYVKVPSSALDTDSAVVSVTAVSTDNSSATGTVDSTTTVLTVYDSEITTDLNTRILNPGQSTSFNITAKNLGNSPESFTIRLDSDAPNWDFDNKLPHYTADLGSYGGYEILVLPVEIPIDTNPGYYNFSINLILDSSGLKVASLQLSVLIEYFADFVIDISNNHLSGKPGKVHEFNAVITNNANHEDDIDLSIDLGDKATDWSYCIGNSCFSSIKVPKGETKSFKIKITTSSNDLVNTEGFSMQITGVSSLNDKVTSIASFKISTNAVYDLSVITEIDTKNGNKGSTIPFQLTVVNEGNALDYVRLPFPDSPSRWQASYADGLTEFELNAKESKTFYLNVQVPSSGTINGGDNLIEVKITSDQHDQIVFLNFTVFIKEESNIEIELSESPEEVTAGTTAKFIILITNTGNTIETINLSLEGSKASWFTLMQSSLKLAPGAYESIIVEVKPPIAQAAGETSGVLNATLVSDSSKTTKITLPFMVLKSDLINTEPDNTQEEGLLPGLSFVSALVIVTLLSILRRRN